MKFLKKTIAIILLFFGIYSNSFAIGTISDVSINGTNPVEIGDIAVLSLTYSDYETGTENSSYFLVNGVNSSCEELLTNPKYANGYIDTTGMTAGSYNVFYRTFESSTCSSIYESYNVGTLVVEDPPPPPKEEDLENIDYVIALFLWLILITMWIYMINTSVGKIQVKRKFIGNNSQEGKEEYEL